MRFAWVLALLLASWNASAVDTGVMNVLAVLEVEVTENAITFNEADVLASTLRDQASTGAKRVNVPVMTRETMVWLAPPDSLKCALGACMATIGKTLQSRYVMGGRVSKIDGKLSMTIEAYESVPGTLLGSKVIRGASVTELQDEMESGLSKLIRGWLEQATGADRAITATTEMVRVRFESTPPGATVTADTGLVCTATPCEEAIPAGERQITFAAKEYEALVTTVSVKAGAAPVAVKLVPNFAELTVVTEPPGLRVFINGKPAGQSPIERMHLLQGSHEVLVDDPCYGKVGEKIELKKAGTRELRFKPEPRWSALDVTVEDQSGNVVDATFEADGRPMLGSRFKVPLCTKFVVARSPAFGRITWSAVDLREKETHVVRLQARAAETTSSRRGQGWTGRNPYAFEPRRDWFSRKALDGTSETASAAVPGRARWQVGLGVMLVSLVATTVGFMGGTVVDQKIAFGVGSLGIAGVLTGTVLLKSGFDTEDEVLAGRP